MALSDVYGAAAVARAAGAWSVISDRTEKYRREKSQRRIDIYYDNSQQLLADKFAEIFQAPEVRDQLQPFVSLAGANSLLKRIVNDTARPIYATPPQRRINPAGQRVIYRQLAQEMRLDRKLDLAMRLTLALNNVFLFCRYIEGRGLALDVISPHQSTIVANPDCPTEAIAIVYDKLVPQPSGGEGKHYVVWDSECYFELDGYGQLVGSVTEHSLGRMPFVEIRRTETVGGYFDSSSGEDLVAASLNVAAVTALVLKLHKMQGEKVIAVAGDAPHDQTIDAGNILQFDPGSTVTPLDLVTSPQHYLLTKAEIETTIAANYGISRQRLNQQDKGADDVALRERTAELMQIARAAELDLFEVVKLVSQEHPTLKMDPEATLEIDYGQLANRVDRKTQLEVRMIERKMGVRSIIDDVLEDNPEFDDEEEAWDEIDENMAAEAEYIKRRRALNIPEDAAQDSPGQDPQQNGALGPAVRDGLISRDTAAVLADTGAEVDGNQNMNGVTAPGQSPK